VLEANATATEIVTRGWLPSILGTWLDDPIADLNHELTLPDGRSWRVFGSLVPAPQGETIAGIQLVDVSDHVAAREAMAARGLGFSVHVDAAWGGYLATLFRNPDGSLRTREEMRAEYRGFPQPHVHAAFAALGGADSVTVDPHKLGYLPYGAAPSSAATTARWRC